ncbi:unnamed protein product [marine sediment metagenome]|uniref:Uncharacterized protein n=1 Tax=marine sediment metagenome TaxID=412755 RepID=X1HHT8_9ZZZZ
MIGIGWIQERKNIKGIDAKKKLSIDKKDISMAKEFIDKIQPVSIKNGVINV